MGNKKRKRTRNIALSVFCMAVLCIGLIMSSYAKTEERKSISLYSTKLNYQDQIPGSFHITKNAEWVTNARVKVTFDLDTVSFSQARDKDLIFVIDTSDAMKNEKILGIKKELTNIVNTVLLDSSNRVSFITYNDTSSILSNLTNGRGVLLGKLEELRTEGEGRSYYQALLNIEKVLKDSALSEERDTRVIVITGGYPNKETPNEVSMYQYLKQQYSNVTIYGIGYEVEGDLEPLRKISDKVYHSNQNTFRNTLHHSLGLTREYDTLEISDYLNQDYFREDSVENVKVTDGEVTREGNQIKWNLEGLPSGKNSKLEYEVMIKEDSDIRSYPVSEKEEIRYKIGGVEETITSTLTPTLGRYYEVIYEGNEPRGCEVRNVPKNSRTLIQEKVEISGEVPVCEGYEFEGWEYITEGVEKVTENEFIMPESDVVLRAIWSKLTIAKSLDGEVYTYKESSIRKVNHIDTSDLWKYKENIKVIVFQDYMKDMSNAVEVIDISSEKNGGILVYILEENGGYTAIIQGDKKIVANKDSSYLFDRFTSLERIEGIEYLDTSEVTNMSHMFGRCSSLKEIDLSHFDTSKVEDMSYMFHDCISLTKVDLSELDLSNVKDMEGMFKGCIKLKEVNFPSEGLPNVDDMKDMFKDCPNLEKITPEDLNIGDDTDTDGMFDGGNNLPELPIKKIYKVEITSEDRGTIFPTSLDIQFGYTNVIMIIPNPGYYLESFNCTNGYTTNAVIDSTSSDHQIVTIRNNYQNQNSSCHATYKMATYKVEYELDGGVVDGTNPESYTIESENITLINPTKTGYNFAGWSGTNGSEQKTVIISKGSVGNRNYTANWTPKQYDITVSNGTGGTINNSNLRIDYGNTTTLTITPSSGYYIESVSCTNGYTTDAQTGTSQTGVQTVTISNNRNDIGSSCTVTYKTVTYTIDYTLNGGTVTGNPESYTVESNNITLINPTRTGYNFTGWTGSDITTAQTSVVIPKGSTGNKTYTANWEIKQFNVGIEKNTGGTTSVSTLAVNYGSSNTFIISPSAGYYIDSVSCTNGYTTNAKTGTSQTAIQTVTVSNNSKDATSTCTVTFSPITYTIGYTLNSGTVTGNPTSYTVESNAITLKNPTKTGYNFTGWTGSNGTTAQTSVTIPKGSTGNKTYTANWTAKSYTVSISGGTGGTVSTTSLSINYAGTKTFTVTPSTGYYLNSVSCTNGYTTNAKTGTSQTAAQTITVSNNSKDSASTCTVSFSTVTYTIGYTLNSGTVTGNPTSYTVESNAITLKNPTRTGYNFTGWTGSNGTTASTSVTIPKGSTGNKTYTANWTAKSYTVSISGGTGGTVSTTSLSINYAGTKTFTVTPSTGYYLNSISCTNGYTTNAKTGTSQTSAQTITVSNNSKDSTSTCTVTFAKEDTFVDDLINLAKTDSTNLRYDGTVDNNLRYIGASPNNYVTFNGEKWRIIGVMNNITDSSGNKASHVKLIRAESIGDIKWDSNSENNWSTASLKTLLNSGDYWNRKNTYSSKGLTATAKTQISNVVWNLGGPYYATDASLGFYTEERGTEVYSENPTEWTGYVGLMYPSDYGYAVGGSVRNTCLSTNLGSYNSNSCSSNDWLLSDTDQFTLSPSQAHKSWIFYVSSYFYVDMAASASECAVRPVVYLKPSVKKTGGSGTNSSPYTIG